MGGVRLVPGVKQDLDHVMQGRDVPELGVGAELGGRLGEDRLEFLLLGLGGFRGVLVPGVTGQDRAHPAGQQVSEYSRTVFSVRSTIFAMMPILAPSETYRMTSTFTLTNTRLSERLFHLTRTEFSSGHPQPVCPIYIRDYA